MSDLIDDLGAAIGAANVLTGEAAKERGYSPWTRVGQPRAVVRPASTEEVAAVLRLANAAGAPVVPWGGLTGLVDGAHAEGAIALSLDRLDRIEAIDEVAGTMTVQAGCKLAAAADAVEAKGLFLPLDLGARGSATIGGNISTNAGGNRVVRWGMMREMVLGLEAVLADGTVVSSLNSLMKNNTGYDLKQLFIGSEGTLGVVTRAVLRLRTHPASQNTAFLAVDDFDQLPALLKRVSRGFGGQLSAFEVIWEDCYQLMTSPPAKGRPPVPYGYPYYVLTEAMGADQAEDERRFEAVLTEALEAGEVVDAVIARTGAERAAMWAIRDDVGQTGRNGPIFAFDVSLKIADMPAYIDKVRADLGARWGEAAHLVVFGHLGDGNLHVIAGVGARDPETRHAVEETVYAPLKAIGGSISAEHGVGLQKRAFLSVSRSDTEIAMMRRLKAAFDPNGVLNPGKIFEVA
ncbi:MAG TPA: FAD-binding oxidoreductase [Caulobacteraceae bacterium]|jgi:FAD/FMN-containing dehydrogenase